MSQWKEYKLKIEAFTPDTIPMARLADYLAELAIIMGETQAVHFVRLEAGSTVIVNKVAIEAVRKVEARTAAVKRDQGKSPETLAYHRLNKMLREDNSTATLMSEDSAEIIKFPGREECAANCTSVRQQGEIHGEVIRVGGKDDPVPILLDVEGRQMSGCYAKRGVAKELARSLFEPVRLFGMGTWNRTTEGDWSLERFVVERFDPLQDEPLSKTFLALRELQGEWGANALQELLNIRHPDGRMH